MNPYVVLNVAPDADDATIRHAYLEAVKLSPPDHAPQRFQAISEAYERIKNETERHRYTLFDTTAPGDSPLDTLIRFARLRPNRKPLPHEAMKSFLKACTKI